MGEIEEKNKEEVSQDPEAENEDAPLAAPEADAPSEDRKGGAGFIILFFIIGLAASLVFGWIIFPKLLYSKKKQPIDFNHVIHVESVDEGCESCHYFREDGSFSGIPKLESCMECHEEVQGEDPNEALFVEEYVAKGKEVDWLVYSKQPDCVFFPHIAHVKKAGLDCRTCHGDIGESTRSRVYEENRISGYSRDIWGKNIARFKKHTWDAMKMDDCAECHKKSGKSWTSVQTQKDACFVCHK
ncbi:Menaquinone reductase, multiheme cytochrome c subunit [Candidatus Desulfarcum epimagneticum]|uniref:Menaquinone reductase, multiheme cytochrome c subunit n=1 Tax=uncultured Desulfobacteraceae bacterium TaxID=218296 RepID=A0A484HD20_9BACT|nr:Menaquinone reductase, multiheme cytochrome c subunit [uncultured Desulfobacteraceae bacterium]